MGLGNFVAQSGLVMMCDLIIIVFFFFFFSFFFLDSQVYHSQRITIATNLCLCLVDLIVLMFLEI